MNPRRPYQHAKHPVRPPTGPDSGDTAEQIISDALGARTWPVFLSVEVMRETNRRLGPPAFNGKGSK
jgi:hypothetical protein